MITLDRVLLWRYVQCTKKGHLHRVSLNDPTLASLHSNQPGHWINRFRLVTLDWLIRGKRDLFSTLDKQRENIVSSRNESRRRSLIIYDITSLVTYFKSLFVKIFQFHFYFSFSRKYPVNLVVCLSWRSWPSWRHEERSAQLRGVFENGAVAISKCYF